MTIDVRQFWTIWSGVPILATRGALGALGTRCNPNGVATVVVSDPSGSGTRVDGRINSDSLPGARAAGASLTPRTDRVLDVACGLAAGADTVVRDVAVPVARDAAVPDALAGAIAGAGVDAGAAAWAGAPTASELLLLPATPPVDAPKPPVTLPPGPPLVSAVLLLPPLRPP